MDVHQDILQIEIENRGELEFFKNLFQLSNKNAIVCQRYSMARINRNCELFATFSILYPEYQYLKFNLDSLYYNVGSIIPTLITTENNLKFTMKKVRNNYSKFYQLCEEINTKFTNKEPVYQTFIYLFPSNATRFSLSLSLLANHCLKKALDQVNSNGDFSYANNLLVRFKKFEFFEWEEEEVKFLQTKESVSFFFFY